MSISLAANVHKLLNPLIGQLVWAVRRGQGTFLTMEFGEPHLRVQDYAAARRRSVHPHGEMHLWIQNASWTVIAGDETCTDQDDHPDIERVLRVLNGQKLTEIHFDQTTCKLSAAFDLSGSLSAAPYAGETEPWNTIWSLHPQRGQILIARADGTAELEPLKS